MIAFQAVFVMRLLSCSTVQNGPVEANNTLTNAMAGFALLIGHAVLMIKEVALEENSFYIESHSVFQTVGIWLVASASVLGQTYGGSF